MCGRFVGFRPFAELKDHFPIDVADTEVVENFNVAPTQKVLAILRRDGRNHLERLHWGFVPYWAADKNIGSRMINARSETVATKPGFRASFRKRRCLVLADGFFEWKGRAGKKQPMFLTLPHGDPFAFAGLWESWDNKGKEPIPYRSCTILTREASESVKPIHHRMPVILKPSAFDAWLDPEIQQVDLLLEIVRDQIHTELISTPVSTRVNSARSNSRENIQAVEAATTGPGHRSKAGDRYSG